MAAQVVQEAAGGGDGVGAAAEGLRGGAGRGPGQAGYPHGGVDQRVAGFLDDAGAGRDPAGSAVPPGSAVTPSSSHHSAGASPSYAISRSRQPVSASTIASAG